MATLDTLIAQALAKGADTCWLTDGTVSGNITTSNPPPVKAVNPGAVSHSGQCEIQVRDAHLEGVSFGEAGGGDHFERGSIAVRSPGATIKNCTIDGVGAGGGYREGIHIYGTALVDASNKVNIDGCTITDFGATNVNHAAIEVGDEQVEDAFGGLAKDERDQNCIIQNCSITGAVQTGTQRRRMVGVHYPTIIKNNTFKTWTGEGVNVKSGNVSILGNTFEDQGLVTKLDTGAVHLRRENDRDVQVEGNLFKNCFLAFEIWGPSSGVMIRNNIIWDATDVALIKLEWSWTDIKFWNNTIFGGVTRHLQAPRGVYFDTSPAASPSGLSFQDNIWHRNVTASGEAAAYAILENAGLNTTTMLDIWSANNNLYYDGYVGPRGGTSGTGGYPGPVISPTTLDWSDNLTDVTNSGGTRDMTAPGRVDPLPNGASGDFTRNDAEVADFGWKETGYGFGDIGAKWPRSEY